MGKSYHTKVFVLISSVVRALILHVSEGASPTMNDKYFLYNDWGLVWFFFSAQLTHVCSILFDVFLVVSMFSSGISSIDIVINQDKPPCFYTACSVPRCWCTSRTGREGSRPAPAKPAWSSTLPDTQLSGWVAHRHGDFQYHIFKLKAILCSLHTLTPSIRVSGKPTCKLKLTCVCMSGLVKYGHEDFLISYHIL